MSRCGLVHALGAGWRTRGPAGAPTAVPQSHLKLRAGCMRQRLVGCAYCALAHPGPGPDIMPGHVQNTLCMVGANPGQVVSQGHALRPKRRTWPHGPSRKD